MRVPVSRLFRLILQHLRLIQRVAISEILICELPPLRPGRRRLCFLLILTVPWRLPKRQQMAILSAKRFSKGIPELVSTFSCRSGARFNAGFRVVSCHSFLLLLGIINLLYRWCYIETASILARLRESGNVYYLPLFIYFLISEG